MAVPETHADNLGQRGRAIGIAYQIPRNTLALLMIAQVVVVLPYLVQLSPWIIAVGLFCGLWRAKVYQGAWDYPNRWIKVVLVFAAAAGVFVSGVGAFSLEATSSLLLVAFALKLIETKSRRDAYLVIFLSYFVIATQFLFDQSILVAFYEFGALIVVTAALVSLNQMQTRVRPLVSLRLAATLVLQALPLTVVLFLLFPRIAPLWTVPLPSGVSTGISDNITPGDIAALTQSDELAFRAVFDISVPLPRDLYWRGLVYSKYDAGTWQSLPRRHSQNATPPPAGGRNYEVLLEPTMRTWLYALDTPFSEDPGVYRTGADLLESEDPVMSVFRYRVSSHRDGLPVRQLSARERAMETTIDRQTNPRTQALAESLKARHRTPEAMISAVLDTIRGDRYRYTLSPPLYQTADSIDEFWFDGQAGFCSHYAGALVFMLRAADVPARMVGGYLGGEVNSITGHLMVRQYDAHAWAEVWLSGRGWVRFDPTAAVAPERVEQGLSAALSMADLATLSLFSSARLGQWDMLGAALRWVDSVEHRWNLWVVGYDNRFQSNLLTRLLGELTPTRIAGALLVGGGLSLASVAGILFWRRRVVHRHPVERAFKQFSQRLAGYGYERRPDESPPAFVRRVALEVGLTEAQVGGLVAELETLLYNPGINWGQRELRALRGQLRRLQFRLAFGSTR